MDSSSVSGNAAYTQGGGFYLGARAVLSATDSIFTSNSASSHGGAIMALSGATFNLTRTTFQSNSGGNGGGIYSTEGTHLYKDCAFYSNTYALYFSGGSVNLVAYTFGSNLGTPGYENIQGTTALTIKNGCGTNPYGEKLWNYGKGQLRCYGSGLVCSTIHFPEVMSFFFAISRLTTLNISVTLFCLPWSSRNLRWTRAACGPRLSMLGRSGSLRPP